MLAKENRLGYGVDEAVVENMAPYKNIITVAVPLKNGEKMLVTDYSSAGKLWTEESKMAVWMLIK